MKKRLICVLTVVLMTVSMLPALSAMAQTSISIGDYLEMGTYYGAPILWRCVDIDENGPLMLSDKIICLKPFDAAGENTSSSHGRGYYTNGIGGYHRQKWGSNYWEDSNISCWLNSREEAGGVSWTCENPPDRVHVSCNAYDDEAGFLANFSKGELSAIKQVTQKSILDGYEYSNDTNNIDSNFHRYNNEIDWMLQNYNTVLSEQVTDYMFLPDIKQINAVYKNSDILGSNYYIGKPTQQCVMHSEFKDEGYLEAGNRWTTWLRTPYASFYFYYGNSNCLRCVGADGNVDYDLANSGNLGVRPAFYLDTEDVSFIGGVGTEKNPYYIEETEQTHETVKIGDYIKMGSYYGESIIWRCVDIDKNGPLMLSDKILCLKPFDAFGSNTNGSHGRGYYANGAQGFFRQICGSNCWEDSNIRCWLNSLSYEGQAKWACGNPPDSVHVLRNAYDNEAGFLRSFTTSELSAIKEVTQKSILDGYEYADSANKKNINSHIHAGGISDVLQNYDTALSEQVKDIIFLPDVKQINAVYNNSSILGDGYYIGEITEQCAENSDYISLDIKGGMKWSSWLRSPAAGNSNSIYTRCVDAAGNVGGCGACDGRIGVRPAFYLNPSTYFLKSGFGTEENPYFVEGEIIPETRITSCVSDGSAVRIEAEAPCIETGGMIIFSVFDKTGNLMHTEAKKTDESINNYDFEYASDSSYKEHKYKIFIWDKGMHPLQDEISANASDF